jgi:C-terminal processing protease CtpA/Prc
MQNRLSRIVTGSSLLLLAGCLAALAYGWTRLQQAEAELARLRPHTNAAAELQEAHRELERLRPQADEVERLRKQTQEIHRLRGQYQEWQRLRDDAAALERENAQLKASHQELLAQHQSLRGQFQSLVTSRPQPSTAAAAVTPNPSTWLGISIQSLSENPQAQSQATGIRDGVIVTTVIPNGPAEAVGLRAGDIITALDDKPMLTAQQLREEMRAKQVGQRVVVDVYRDGLIHKLGVNSEAFPTAP